MENTGGRSKCSSNPIQSGVCKADCKRASINEAQHALWKMTCLCPLKVPAKGMSPKGYICGAMVQFVMKMPTLRKVASEHPW